MGTKKKQVVQKKAQKNWKTAFNYNIISILILLISFNLLVTKVDGYKWVVDILLLKNFEVINQYKHLSTEQKHEVKQGFFFTYLNFINTNTPENAVILMPPDSIIDSVDAKYKLNFLKDRRKTTYFIYPRKSVYQKNMANDSMYLSKVTHVAIVNYYGYENLNYNTENKQQFTVLPVSPNNKK